MVQAMVIPSTTSSPQSQSIKPLSGEEMGRAALKSLGAPSSSSTLSQTSTMRPTAIPLASYSSQSSISNPPSSSTSSSFFFTSQQSSFDSPISSTFASPAHSPAFSHASAGGLKRPYSQAHGSATFQNSLQAEGDENERINHLQSLAISQQPPPSFNHQRPNLPFNFESSFSSSSSSSSSPARESFLRYSPRQTPAEWSRSSRSSSGGQDQDVEMEDQRPYSSETVSSDKTVTEQDQHSNSTTSSSSYYHLRGSSSIRTLPDRRNRSIDDASTHWFNPPALPQPRTSLPSSIYSSSHPFSNSSSSPFQHQSSPILGASPRGRILAPLPRRSPTPILGGPSGIPAATHSGQFVASPSPSASDSIMRDASQSRSRSGSQASGLGLDSASFPPSPRRSLAELRSPHLERERGERQVYGNNFGSFVGREPSWVSSSADKRRWSADELVEAAQAKTEELQASEDAEMREVGRLSASPGKKRGLHERDGRDYDRQDSDDTIGRGSVPVPPTREEIMSRLQSKVKQRLAEKSNFKKNGPTPSPMPSTPSSASTSVSPSPRLAAESASSIDSTNNQHSRHYSESKDSNRSPSLQDLSTAAASTSMSTQSNSSAMTRHGKTKMNSLPLPPRPTTADREQRAALGIETLLNAAQAADQSG